MTEGADERQRGFRQNAKDYALGILFWVALWALAAVLMGNELLLAGPVDTFWTLVSCLGDATFWSAVGTTTARILLVGTTASLTGLGLGALAWHLPWLSHLLAPALHVMKSAPVACVVVVVLVAWGQAGAFMVIVAFVTLPPWYVAMQEALDARPRQTESVLRLAGVSRWRTFAACTWPTVLPYLTVAAKTSIALGWRAGVTAELLSLPLGSIGAGVYASKLTLDSAQLLVWTITVMVLSWLNERLVLAVLDGSAHLARRHSLETVSAQAQTSHKKNTHEDEAAQLRLTGVEKTFGEHCVFAGFDLAVGPGERVCLMAPTGTGKTTALKIALGLLAPDKGWVQTPRRFGATMQDCTLIPQKTALENVMLCAAPSMSAQNVEGALARLLPKEALEKRASELSGGMRRLTEIARALLSDGQAIVLDEPFAGLDPKSKEQACAFISEELRGRPLVLATHDALDAARLNARIIRLPKAS